MAPQNLIDDDMTEVVDGNLPRVDLVGKAANGHGFILMKADGDNPSLFSTDQVEALLKEAEEPNMTDSTTPSEEELAKAGDLDVTEPLADAPAGTPNVGESDPGSPAWEAVDAATAEKWGGILARAKNALELLSGREDTEAVTGNGDGDSMNAWALDDAAAAIDFAIGIVAQYAAGEKADVEIMQELEKSIGSLNADDLQTVEGFGSFVKAGRVLSGSNQKLLEDASESIQKVLSTLPTAPEVDETVTKTDAEEAPVTDTTAPVEKTAEPEAVEVAPGLVFKALDAPIHARNAQLMDDALAIMKAEAMTAVFDQDGNLIGAVKPNAIVPLDGGKAAADDAATEPGSDELDAQPAAAAGTPTDAAPAAAAPAAAPVAKQAEAVLTKSEVEQIVKTALETERAEQAEVIKGLQDEVNFLKSPAPSKVAVNGAAQMQMRGQDKVTAGDGASVDLTKAADLRVALEKADTAEEASGIRDQMNNLAAGALMAARQQPQRQMS